VLDLLETEPPDPHHPLLELENSIPPHIAGLTEESQERTSRMVAIEGVQRIRRKDFLMQSTFEKISNSYFSFLTTGSRSISIKFKDNDVNTL
jgi:phosphoglycerate dehydrogenase-like enzyme